MPSTLHPKGRQGRSIRAQKQETCSSFSRMWHEENTSSPEKAASSTTSKRVKRTAQKRGSRQARGPSQGASCRMQESKLTPQPKRLSEFTLDKMVGPQKAMIEDKVLTDFKDLERSRSQTCVANVSTRKKVEIRKDE